MAAFFQSLRARTTPLGVILAGLAVLYLVGLGWGLPAADGWDNDGIAPRDFLYGGVQAYVPGDYFTYPPLHLLILDVINLPVILVGALRAPGLDKAALIGEFTRVPYMTVFAVVGRLVNAALALGIVALLAELAAEIATPRARPYAALFVGLNMALVYYAHATNLDVPYMFWVSAAFLAFVRGMKASRARADADGARWIGRGILFAVFAITTKDQAYATFALSVPVATALFLAEPGGLTPASRRAAALAIGKWAVAGALLLLLVDGAITNPSGFRARLHFLSGPASQNYASYAKNAAGVEQLLSDILRRVFENAPPAALPLGALGVVVALARRPRAVPAAASLLPLLGAISFTLAFNCVARRSEHRFVLPQMMFLGVYAGVGLGWIDDLCRARGRGWMLAPVVALLVGAGLLRALAVDVNLLRDPRYAAEAWLSRAVVPGDVVELCGNNSWLPRPPALAHVVRVDTKDRGRSPLPGVEETDRWFYAEPGTGRAPRFVVLSEAWASMFHRDASPPPGGYVNSPVMLANLGDQEMHRFLFGLYDGTVGYHEVYRSTFDESFWPRVWIHGMSTDVRIFERN